MYERGFFEADCFAWRLVAEAYYSFEQESEVAKSVPELDLKVEFD